MLIFEYDRQKSLSNVRKHGISFEEAWRLWAGEYIELPVKNVDEKRFIVIDQIDAKYWAGVITYSNGRIRLISIPFSKFCYEYVFMASDQRKNDE